ncbi:nucleotide exchange factor GrpE [Candidatus Saccharibacteria bacterium]|nr:nucleotide exchange factor GrpE [Candidatus Saccharibacteria bacterium]
MKQPLSHKTHASGKPNPTSATKDSSADARVAELINDLQRTRADFENYRKQMDLQKSQAATFARQETVLKVLPLLDDMERAIVATPALAPLAKNLEKTIQDLGLEKINSTPGTEFNPDLHDAVMMDGGEGEKEVISESLRSGYIYDGVVIRPAMVKVKNA